MPEGCPTMGHSGWLSGDLSNFHKIKPVAAASSFNPEVLLAETRAPSKHVLQWHYLLSLSKMKIALKTTFGSVFVSLAIPLVQKSVEFDNNRNTI